MKKFAIIIGTLAIIALSAIGINHFSTVNNEKVATSSQSENSNINNSQNTAENAKEQQNSNNSQDKENTNKNQDSSIAQGESKNTNEISDSNSSQNVATSELSMAPGSGGGWTEQEQVAALDFAKKVKTAIINKDMNKISELIAFPIVIDFVQSKDEITVKNVQDFLKLKFDDIFSQKMCKKIIETKELFANQHGFMFGNGEIWFSPINDGTIKITAISNTGR